MAKLQAAVGLYRGAFLVGTYSDWCETLRRQIEASYRAALGSLAAYHATRKEYSEAIPLLERVLEVDPYDEDAYYQLMTAYVGMGEPAWAKQCYKRYERVARDELGARPSARLGELYRTLQAGGPVLP